MLSCNFKVKVRAGDYCSLGYAGDGVLLFSQTRRRCDGEDNCIIYQIYKYLMTTKEGFRRYAEEKEKSKMS